VSGLAGAVDGVIGVDTHRDTLAAAATDPLGGVLGQASVRADAAGYRRLLGFARAQVPGRRCWAVEGAGSYGAGPAAFLHAQGERVVEVAGPSGRRGAAAPRATPWTPSAPPVKLSPRTIRLHRVAVATRRRCGCCWPPATAPPRPR
jgi:Transposase